MKDVDFIKIPCGEKNSDKCNKWMDAYYMKRNTYLNIPLFLGGTDHCNRANEAKTKAVVKCRIHIERDIEKIKRFYIIKQTVPT